MTNKVPYKPDGYQNVIPYLHVNSAAKLIAFMKDVFDAQEIAIYPRPDGTVGHAALRIGDSVIELADVSPEWPAMPCAMQVYVSDTDDSYHRALKAGASSLLPPATQFYGDRTASVRDSCGNNWYIATQKEIVSKEEVDRRLPPWANQRSNRIAINIGPALRGFPLCGESPPSPVQSI